MNVIENFFATGPSLGEALHMINELARHGRITFQNWRKSGSLLSALRGQIHFF
jgi:hypothetical protein